MGTSQTCCSSCADASWFQTSLVYPVLSDDHKLTYDIFKLVTCSNFHDIIVFIFSSAG